MKLAAITAGMLTEDDQVSLAAGMEIVDGSLADRAVGARHRLHPLAAQAIREIYTEGGCDASSWYVSARGYGISAAQFVELVGFLYDIGGIRVRRRLPATARISRYRLRSLAQGMTPEWLPRRFPATWLGVCGAATRFMGTLVVCAGLLCLLVVILQGQSPRLISYVLLFLATMWVGIVAHEATHVLIIRKYGGSAVMLQRGLRLGVLHRPLSRKQELCSALLGPIAGVVVAALLSVIEHSRLLLFINAAVAVLQLLALLPGYGDGNILWKAIFK